MEWNDGKYSLISSTVDDGAILDIILDDFNYGPPPGFDKIMLEQSLLWLADCKKLEPMIGLDAIVQNVAVHFHCIRSIML